MPCYQVNLVSVEFTGQNAGILAQTVKALSGTIQASKDRKIINVSWQGQTVTIQDGLATGQPEYVNQLRVSYAKQVVKEATAQAKQRGWNVQQTGNQTTLTIGRQSL